MSTTKDNFIKKGKMLLEHTWDVKFNETRKYEQHVIAGQLPQRYEPRGKKQILLKKEWFFGQAEKEKDTQEWVKDSVRVVRIRADAPPRETRHTIDALLQAICWFAWKVQHRGFMVVDDEGNMVALFGDGSQRMKMMEKLKG